MVLPMVKVFPHATGIEYMKHKKRGKAGFIVPPQLCGLKNTLYGGISRERLWIFWKARSSWEAQWDVLLGPPQL